MRRILLAVGVAFAAFAVATLSGTAAAPAGGPPRYLDQKASIHNRVNDLLHRMTLQEKVVGASSRRNARRNEKGAS